MTQTIQEELLQLREEKIAYREADKIAKALKQTHDIHQARLIERMEAEKVDSLSSDGTLFVPTTTRFATVQDREAFTKWALEHEPQLVEYKERGELINQLIREKLDNGEPLPPGLGFHVREYISHNQA